MALSRRGFLQALAAAPIVATAKSAIPPTQPVLSPFPFFPPEIDMEQVVAYQRMVNQTVIWPGRRDIIGRSDYSLPIKVGRTP